MKPFKLLRGDIEKVYDFNTVICGINQFTFSLSHNIGNNNDVRLNLYVDNTPGIYRSHEFTLRTRKQEFYDNFTRSFNDFVNNGHGDPYISESVISFYNFTVTTIQNSVYYD